MATQATGAQSKLVMGFESVAYGTTAAAGFVLPINSSGLKSTQPKNDAGTIRGDLNPARPFDGFIAAAGQIKVPVDSTAFWYWMTLAFGTCTTTGASSPYTHVFEAGSTSRPSATIEHQFLDLDTPQYIKYTGCKINKFAISGGGDGELVATFDVVASKETIGTSSFDGSATEISLSRLKNSNMTAQEGGTTVATSKNIDFSINWNMDTSQYVIGGGGILGSLPDGIMSINGNYVALFDSVTVLNKAIASTESSILMTFANGSASSLSCFFPEIEYSRNSPGIDGPKGISISLPWHGYYDDAVSETSAVITLINGDAHAA